ncbi:hypothetical protein CEXT_624621 [Caerostris extrusa]|uniref:Uncharacterized protein n=1 Tax=Caerostris extrusa TaxID=172846 RepID=A0AAV4XEJ7_CAEEX|nr:hypothetical protein CEXT_624621 [Caerostris extrusa]
MNSSSSISCGPFSRTIYINMEPRITRETFTHSSQGSLFQFRVKRSLLANIRDKVQIILSKLKISVNTKDLKRENQLKKDSLGYHANRLYMKDKFFTFSISLQPASSDSENCPFFSIFFQQVLKS